MPFSIEELNRELAEIADTDWKDRYWDSQTNTAAAFPNVAACIVEFSHYYYSANGAGQVISASQRGSSVWSEWFIHQYNVCHQNGDPRTMEQLTLENFENSVNFIRGCFDANDAEYVMRKQEEMDHLMERMVQDISRYGPTERTKPLRLSQQRAVMADADDISTEELLADIQTIERNLNGEVDESNPFKTVTLEERKAAEAAARARLAAV